MNEDAITRAYFDLAAAGDKNELSRLITALEAAGYTVTPPDPLAADREFLAGLQKTAFCLAYGSDEIMDGELDSMIPAAMAYLRANKGRL